MDFYHQMEQHFYANDYSLKGYNSPFLSNIQVPNTNASRLNAIDAEIARKQAQKGAK